MIFKIPFTFSNIEKLKKRSKFFAGRIGYKKNSGLADNLKNSGAELTREEYIGISVRSSIIIFVFLFLISTTILFLLKQRLFHLYGLGIALLFAGFVFFSQMNYPKIYVSRRQKDIEKNLIPALQDMAVQLSSGIALFGVLTNISDADYGELSVELKKAVKRINSGEPETDVLDDLAKRNPSVFFRRTLWQISNGMRAGSEILLVIKDSIRALNEEQLIQVQNYGNKLNPLIMFYMLISVIIPALSITFLTIISSMVNLPSTMTMLLFVGLFIFVVLIQIMFLGLIKSRRPSLL
ncbi:type II secretion system F family protein [Candidatus Pacearchaeota archaeon]|nr:type II secretion system F family protein [Candidatus Pacearchaeota archaeon]